MFIYGHAFPSLFTRLEKKRISVRKKKVISMDNLSQKAKDEIEKFIASKLQQQPKGEPHEYTEFVSETLSVTQKLPKQCRGDAVQYIYQKVSADQSNGFKPDYDITTLINMMSEIRAMGCKCGFMK
jgi:hypothetical protein